MTIIIVKLNYEKKTKTIKDCHHGKDRTTDIIYENVDLKNIEINVEKCDNSCDCKYTSISKTNKYDDLIEANQCITTDYYFSSKIKKIIKKNIYVKIHKLLENNYDSDQAAEIRQLINSIENVSKSTEYSDDNIINKDDLIKITTIYPFITNFDLIKDQYIAKMHISDEIDTDKFYLTFNNMDDSWSCNCSLGSQRGFLPLQLSIGYPSKNCDQYDSFDDIYLCKKSRYGSDNKYECEYLYN